MFTDQSNPGSSTLTLNRRQLIGSGAALGAGAVVLGGSRLRLVAAQDSTPVAGSNVDIVTAANDFLATLSDDEKSAVLFDWTDSAQRQRWSNFPEGLFDRAGLMWGNISEDVQNAWLNLMQVTMSEDGYDRVRAEWAADDQLSGGGGGGQGGGPGGMNYGMQYYWIAIIGTPSESDPWQWQWGGHHVTVNATLMGDNLSLNPSFIGVQPATYTDADGNEVRPLGDIEDAAFALVNSLDDDQKATAILGDTYVDLVLGPGQDGKVLQAEGLAGSAMTDDQRATALQIIGYYTGLANDAAAAAYQAIVEETFDDTYLAWYGSITQGEAAYFRLAGPRIVIEYSPQSMGGNAMDHIHGIFRDPENDYGASFTGEALSS